MSTDDNNPTMDIPALRITRPRFLAALGLGGAAATLAACSTYSEQSAPSSSGEAATPAAPSGSQALAATDQVPVGSGIIVDDGNLRARRFYERNGYRLVASRPQVRVPDVASGQNFLLLTKPHG